MVQIALYTRQETQGMSWALTPNCASQKQITFNVEANQIYKESCALAIGESYELRCDSYSGNGWFGSFLVIENKAYCQNFQAGSSETTTIKIEGTYTLKAASLNSLYLKWN